MTRRTVFCVATLLVLSCTSNAPTPTAEASLTGPAGLVGTSITRDARGDVRQDEGRELFESVDLVKASIDADGLILTTKIVFVLGVPEPLAGRALGCRVFMEASTGNRYLVDLDRRDREQGDYWTIGRSSPNLELDEGLYRLVVSSRSIEARIPLYMLRGLTPTFDWEVACSYANEGSRSVDTVRSKQFRGTLGEA